MSNFRELSKQNFISDNSTEHLNAGSLQRIADATELMVKNYLQLQKDAELYKRWYNEAQADKQRLYKSISALKGVITKLKKSK